MGAWMGTCEHEGQNGSHCLKCGFMPGMSYEVTEEGLKHALLIEKFRNRLRDAVNQACTCKSLPVYLGEGRYHHCPACEVWHRMQDATRGKEVQGG